jgi:ribosomal protein S27E
MALWSVEPAAAQQTETEGVSVDIVPNATLLKSGAVRVEVQITCPREMDVLEAHVSVSQDEQTIFGRSGMKVQCTGSARTYRTVVTPQEGQFHTGTAYSSAYVLVRDPATGATQQGSDTEPNLTIN